MLHRHADLGGPAVAAKPPEMLCVCFFFGWPFLGCFALVALLLRLGETEVYVIYNEGTGPKCSVPRKNSANRFAC